MSRKQSSESKTKARIKKVSALAKRAGTPGEQHAAEAALVRLGRPLEPPAGQGVHLEATVIKALRAPASGNRITFDDQVAGFGVRVTAAGTKSFIFNYRVKGTGQQRRVTIGGFPNWTTGAARTKAKDYRKQVDDGGDPRGDFEELREAPTMDDLCNRFIREHLPKRRASTVKTYLGTLNLHVRPFFGKHTKVTDVSYSDVNKLHLKITALGSTYVANRAVAMLSRMFSLAIRWGLRSDNPAKGIERNAETKRKRYLSGEELLLLTAALAKHPNRQFANIVGLLMLTGARKGEVLSMRFDNLDLDRGIWSKPGSTTKQKSDHVVPLSKKVVVLLKAIRRDTNREYVFPGDSESGHVADIQKPWVKLCSGAGIAGVRIHDLRHSFASQLVNSGASLPLIGALLGHSNPTTTSRYAHLFDDPQRAAVEKIGELVGGGVGKGGHHG
jgi:integrase